METKGSGKDETMAAGCELTNHALCVRALTDVFDIGGFDFVAKCRLHRFSAFVVTVSPAVVTDSGTDVDKAYLKGSAACAGPADSAKAAVQPNVRALSCFNIYFLHSNYARVISGCYLKNSFISISVIPSSLGDGYGLPGWMEGPTQARWCVQPHRCAVPRYYDQDDDGCQIRQHRQQLRCYRNAQPLRV